MQCRTTTNRSGAPPTHPNRGVALIYRQMLFQCLHIGVRIAAEYHVFLADDSDAHAAVHVERARDDTRTVELLVDDARADREAVQPDDKAEQRGAVAHLYGFRHIEHAQQLLGKIERVALALLEHKVGIGAQFIERDARPGGERVVPADENVRPCDKQKMKFQKGRRRLGNSSL